jgi:predicted flap endonuclease-1-like 5' DNA nuclease
MQPYFHYFTELAVFILLSYFVGCWLGSLWRKLFGKQDYVATAVTLDPATVATTSAATFATASDFESTSPALSVAASLQPVQVNAGESRNYKVLGVSPPAARDELTRIVGIGAASEKSLHEIGVTRFEQIAKWTDEDIASVEERLQSKGSIKREGWVRQARLLAAGNETDFDREFGRGRAGRELARAAEAQAEETKGRGKDNLMRLRGMRATDISVFNGLGVHRFRQIADWTSADVSKVDGKFGDTGRVAREEWIRQAEFLADGNDAEFNALYANKPPTKPASLPVEKARVQKTEQRQHDELLRLKGIGPKNLKALNDMGITRFRQIADWTPDDVSRVEEKLEFDGRIEREEWIRQAELLANGKDAEFETQFGEGKKVSGKPAKPKGVSGPRGGKADDLKRLSGVGPKYEKILHGLGFFHFDQIAAWTAEQVKWVDDHLNFNGRIAREEWVRQASLLADGKEEKFMKDYGTGGLKSASGETMSGARTRK